MGLLDLMKRLISDSAKEAQSAESIEGKSEEQETGTARKQGINPMVRNADADFEPSATNYKAANRLVRDCSGR